MKEYYKWKTDMNIVAEVWELSAHKDGTSIICNGEYEGKNFIEYLEIKGKTLWGAHAQHFPQFPILIKLIDARDGLSIQVHPDDEYAKRVEKGFGKNEMWYIMDCEPGSFYIME